MSTKQGHPTWQIKTAKKAKQEIEREAKEIHSPKGTSEDPTSEETNSEANLEALGSNSTCTQRGRKHSERQERQVVHSEAKDKWDQQPSTIRRKDLPLREEDQCYPKIDGVRVLIEKVGDSLTLQDRSGKILRTVEWYPPVPTLEGELEGNILIVKEHDPNIESEIGDIRIIPRQELKGLSLRNFLQSSKTTGKAKIQLRGFSVRTDGLIILREGKELKWKHWSQQTIDLQVQGGLAYAQREGDLVPLFPGEGEGIQECVFQQGKLLMVRYRTDKLRPNGIYTVFETLRTQREMVTSEELQGSSKMVHPASYEQAESTITVFSIRGQTKGRFGRILERRGMKSRIQYNQGEFLQWNSDTVPLKLQVEEKVYTENYPKNLRYLQ